MAKNPLRLTCAALIAALLGALALLGFEPAPQALPRPAAAAQVPLAATPLPGLDRKALYQKGSRLAYAEATRFVFRFMSRVERHFGAATPAIYAPDVFGFPILPQPEGEDAYVSTKAGRVTQFGLAARHGVLGLLAHNYLAGEDFYKLQVGQHLWIARSKHKMQLYEIIAIESFQKLAAPGQPDRYVELGNQRVWSTAELFERYYTGSPHLVLQTCLERNGRLDWGLTFIVATPVSH